MMTIGQSYNFKNNKSQHHNPIINIHLQQIGECTSLGTLEALAATATLEGVLDWTSGSEAPTTSDRSTSSEPVGESLTTMAMLAGAA